MKLLTRALLAATLALAVTASQASTFNIQVNFGSGFSPSQQTIVSQVEAMWESAVTGYKPGVNIPSLAISAFTKIFDGAYGVLGSMRLTADTTQGGYVYATAGELKIDSADVDRMEADGSLYSLIEHEMAQVMGFGTLWIGNGVYVNESGRYTGANALAAYRAEFDPNAAFIPVDIVSGAGTRNAHWSETWAGGPNETLTGFLNTPTFLSNTSIQSFADIGYTVAAPAAVPLPAALGMLVGGLGALGVVGARRHQSK